MARQSLKGFGALGARFAPIANVEDYEQHVGKADNLSGEIFLEPETLTPLFIGGNGSKTFAPVDAPIIPGSSLRGLFKNLFKIVTCGAFRGKHDFNDERIYFRCLMAPKDSPAWMKDLRAHYVDLMTDKSTGGKKARPGFLVSKKSKFFIVPSKYSTDRKDDYLMISEFQARYGSVGNRDSRVVWGEDDELKRARRISRGKQIVRFQASSRQRVAQRRRQLDSLSLHRRRQSYHGVRARVMLPHLLR